MSEKIVKAVVSWMSDFCFVTNITLLWLAIGWSIMFSKLSMAFAVVFCVLVLSILCFMNFVFVFKQKRVFALATNEVQKGN